MSDGILNKHPDIRSMLDEMELDIVARNAEVGDVIHDSHFAAKCELTSASPNYGYIRALTANFIKKVV